MANHWFRVYAEFAHDPKVQMMSEAMQRRYIMLMCMRCSNDISRLQDEELAFALRISNEDLAETKALFMRKGFIDESWSILNWDKYQSNDSLRPPADVWRLIRERIFLRDDFTCQYCGVRGQKLECDHVVPVSRGGGNEDSNLVTACFSCNRSKHTKLVSEWRCNHG